MKTKQKIIVVDLEATCWNEETPQGQEQEIIEIGICILDTVDGSISANKGILIKPERSEVSPFCTQLTTITPALLEREGIGFEAACAILRDEFQAHQYTWASYGAWDRNMMRSQCNLLDIAYPFSAEHINVKEMFARRKGLKKRTGMNGALNILGLPLEGTHHRGVDDALNIARILSWSLG
ncbi:MAG: exonuclease domain-containing protein [Sphingobacteriales bacterium]|nr:MAG: exonuclease domain-containing protein [Sphingobacteriales bacterium]